MQDKLRADTPRLAVFKPQPDSGGTLQMTRKLAAAISLLLLLGTITVGQDRLEEKTPPISNAKIKPERIKNKKVITIKLAGKIEPKKIVKTGKPSKQTEKEERRFDEALKRKLKIKEEQKIKLEKIRARELLTKPAPEGASDEVEPKEAFDINTGAGSPPDNTVAISSTGFIVAADNSQIGFYREDGTTLNEFTYPDFLSGLDDSIGNNTSDPKVIYDPEERKFIFFIQSGSSSNSSRCVLAFSNSDDPTEAWAIYDFNTISGDDLWFDYPSLSVNYREVFLTGNLFDDDRDFSGNVIYMFDKDDGYASRDINGVSWRDVKPSGSSNFADGIIAVPAARTTMYGPGHYLLSTSSVGGGDVFLYHITSHLEDDPELDKYRIDVPDYEVPASAAQKGTDQRLDVGDCRIRSAYYQHGKVYFVFSNDDGNNFSGISYNRIRINDLYHKSKFFHGNENFDYSYPAITNRKSNETYSRALLVFQSSGRTIFPQIRKRLLQGNMSAVSSSSRLRGGASFRNRARWGDYISVQRKYGTKTAWTTGHTPSTTNVWRTHLISIGLP